MKKIITKKIESISKNIFEKFKEPISKLVKGQHGVYALYDEGELYYVGKAVDLERRVKQHLKDNHKALWTHFSLFFTEKKEYISIIESIIISIAQPLGNKIKPKGKIDNKDIKLLEKMIKEQQDRERTEMFGRKVVVRPLKNKSQRPSLEGYFKSSRPLKKNYKGKEYTATLLTTGEIKFRGKLYSTPTAAAMQIIESESVKVNGWMFWFVKNDEGNWVKLNDL